MLLKKALLSSDNLNNSFLSKTAIGEQTIASTLKLAGAITLKTGGSLLTDNANAGYLQIDPQGSHMILYDGANDMKFSVFASNGTKSTYMQTFDTANYGLIDIAGVSQLNIATNSGVPIEFGGNINLATDKRLIFKANSTYGGTLSLGGNGQNAGTNQSSISTTDGDLWIDAGIEEILYLNVNSGRGGIEFGNGLTMSHSKWLANGNLGIGNTAPAFKLDVTGDIRASGTFVSSAGTIRDAGGGWIRTYGATGWYNNTYAGGWYMTDSTWIRNYASKGVKLIKNTPAINSASYSQGNLVVETSDGSNPIIGFHRNGYTALGLYHTGDVDPLSAVTAGGAVYNIGMAGKRTSTELNNASTLASGIYSTSGGLLNNDGSVFQSGWWHVIHSRHLDNNGYAGQLAMPLSTSSTSIYTRTANGTTWGAWKEIGGGGMKASAKYIGSGTTPSTWTQIINVTGSGKFLATWSTNNSSYGAKFRVTVDGVTATDSIIAYNEGSSTGHGNIFGAAGGNMGISFAVSLVVEVTLMSYAGGTYKYMYELNQ